MAGALLTSRSRERILAIVLVAGAAAYAAGCASYDKRLEDHTKAFESLAATAARVVETWLAGQVTGTYASTALEQTFRLVEQERTALAARPPALADPRGAQLSQRAERLARLVAGATMDVGAANAPSLRVRLAEFRATPEQR